uniref:Uncharacterized protein n=1 Tax=Sinocyclocheilus rhinocerous TaxID=307959 RepID=A0A673J3D0_9TELE
MGLFLPLAMNCCILLCACFADLSCSHFIIAIYFNNCTTINISGKNRGSLKCILTLESPDVYIVERLFSSSLMVVKSTEICNYSYSNNTFCVPSLQMLVVCLEEALYILNIKDIKLLKSLLNTPPNPKCLCALSVNRSSSYLAHPGSFTAGEITLCDALNLNMVTVISAHASHVAAIAFNASGTNLASACEKGTVIRVLSAPDGKGVCSATGTFTSWKCFIIYFC